MTKEDKKFESIYKKRKMQYVKKEKELAKIDRFYQKYALAKEYIKISDFNNAIIILKRLLKELYIFQDDEIKKNVMFTYYITLGILKYTDKSTKGIMSLLIDEIYVPSGQVNISETYLLELANAYFHGGEYEEAKKYYNMLLNKKSLSSDANLKLCYIALRENEYELAMNYLENVSIEDISYDYPLTQKLSTLYYIRKKLNIPRDYDKEYYRTHKYHISQLENYSEEKAKNHILKHIENDDYEKNKESLFLTNIKVSSLFNEVKDIISPQNLLVSSSTDKYVVSFDKVIGKFYKEETSAVTVVTFPSEPDKILTMYPCKEIKFNKKVRK